MDGNRRWAVQNGLPLQAAYRKAAERAESVVESCQYLGIEAVTLFVFSSQNWKREPNQVLNLLSLLDWKITQAWHFWKSRNLRVRFMGDFGQLSSGMIRLIHTIERQTHDNDGLVLTFALSYGGRKDLVHAVQQIAQHVQKGAIEIADIDEAFFEQHLQSHNAFGSIGDPDLFIRTSGEQRLSDFLLWDMAYTELSFQSVLWPDFAPQHLKNALEDYSQRNRRYGR